MSKVLVRLAGGAAAVVLIGGVVPAATALAAPATHRPAAAASSVKPHSRVRPDCIGGGHCPIVIFTDYKTNSSTGTVCFNIVEYTVSLPINSNWSDYGCRNVDEWFSTAYSVRLYYSPNQAGAWICVNAGFNKSLSGDTFKNGSGLAGYGQEVWNNIASSHVFSGTCTNPTT